MDHPADSSEAGGHTPPHSVSSDAASVASFDDGQTVLKLVSVLGGEPVTFFWRDGEEGCNDDVINIIFEVIARCLEKLPSLRQPFQARLPQKELDQVNRRRFEDVRGVLKLFNSAAASIAKLWRGQTNPEAGLWSQERADPTLCKHICSIAFNSAVRDVNTLNKCYKGFSSEVYGETSFEQMQLLIEQLDFGETDIFVDLGSGVGHLVTYVAGATKVKQSVGIEIGNIQSKYATTLGKEFEKWMKWYKKKYRTFNLYAGSFLDEEHRELITKKATIIFINNFAFTPDLETKIKNLLIAECQEGTRIVTTKAYATGKKNISDRLLGDVEAILDVCELKTVDSPTSWTDKPVKFYMHTVNRQKIERYFSEKKSNSLSSENSRRTSLSSKEGSSSRDSASPSGHERKLATEPSSSDMAAIHAAERAFEEDDEGVYGPTTRHRWKQWVDDNDKKKKRKAGGDRWDGEDHEYVPHGAKKAKKTPEEKAAEKQQAKLAKQAKKAAEKAAKAAARMPKNELPLGRSRVVVTEEAIAGMEEMHSMIATTRPSEETGPGLVRVPLPPARVETPPAVFEDVKPSTPTSSLLVPVPMTHTPTAPTPPSYQPPIVLPPNMVVLDLTNPLDRCIYDMRDEISQHAREMQTAKYKMALLEEIRNAQMQKDALLERVRVAEQAVVAIRTSGVGNLHERLAELGMSHVQTPTELLQGSKNIVAEHKELTQQVSQCEAEVAAQETRLFAVVPYGKPLIERLHLLDSEEEITSGTGDKYREYITQIATEHGFAAPRFEMDESGSTAASLASVPESGLLSPGASGTAPRRSRQRPRAAGGGRKGKLEAPNEEMEAQVKEMVIKCMQVENQAKEKERRVRGSAPQVVDRTPRRVAGAVTVGEVAAMVALPRVAGQLAAQRDDMSSPPYTSGTVTTTAGSML